MPTAARWALVTTRAALVSVRGVCGGVGSNAAALLLSGLVYPGAAQMRMGEERAMADFIFTLQGMTKVHPPDKKVLEDVYLSFLPGAKIGVIGGNGSGKSTL